MQIWKDVVFFSKNMTRFCWLLKISFMNISVRKKAFHQVFTDFTELIHNWLKITYVYKAVLHGKKATWLVQSWVLFILDIKPKDLRAFWRQSEWNILQRAFLTRLYIFKSNGSGSGAELLNWVSLFCLLNPFQHFSEWTRKIQIKCWEILWI